MTSIGSDEDDPIMFVAIQWYTPPSCLLVEFMKRTDELVIVEFEPLIHLKSAAGTELEEQLMFSVTPSIIVVRLMLGVITGFVRSAIEE